MAKRIQPINPGAPQPVPEAAPPPSLPGFGRPINLVNRVAPRTIQPFPSMGRRLRDPNAIPLANRNTPMPVPDVPPIEPYPLAGGPDLSPIPVDQGLGATPTEQRLGKFTEPAATPPPAPGAYNAVRNAGRGPAMPFVKPGTALALPNPAGPPATIPGRPAIPMGGPAPPAPPPQGQLPGSTQRSLPAPGPAQPSRPAIPMGGANAYTPPNAAGATEAIGGATPNRPGRFAGALRPAPGPNFNLVRDPLALPAPEPAFNGINLGRRPLGPPPPPDPFDMRTAQRGGSVQPGRRQDAGQHARPRPAIELRPGPRPARDGRPRGGSDARDRGRLGPGGVRPRGRAPDWRRWAGWLPRRADGIAGIFDGRFRAVPAPARQRRRRRVEVRPHERAGRQRRSTRRAVNMGKGAAEFIKDPGRGDASLRPGLRRSSCNASSARAAARPRPCPRRPPQVPAPDGNPNGLSPGVSSPRSARAAGPAELT
jgi:hypothetical protein